MALVGSGHAEVSEDGSRFRVARNRVEGAARPDWIWLPNTLVDGAGPETPPIELVRQTGSALTLRLLVNLYGSQILDENGGIHFRSIRRDFARHKIGEEGSLVVWGFVAGQFKAWQDSAFIAPHLAGAPDNVESKAAWKEFWDCWDMLNNLGLVEVVGHLVHADTDEGEIIHPVALPGTGLAVEQELGRAAQRASKMLVTDGQWEWAQNQGVVIAAPVQQHIVNVQMVGVARLRYRPKTNRTLAFTAREQDWKKALNWLSGLAEGPLATSRSLQC